jgi:hypothetical protein
MARCPPARLIPHTPENLIMKPVWKTAAVALLCTLGALAHAQPKEMEGVKLAPTVQVGPAVLAFNGAGLRTRVFFKVYVAALYVPQTSTDARVLLADKGPRRMAITMLRDVDAATFAQALTDGLRDNHTEAQLAALKTQTETLVTNLKLAGEARKGDAIHFEYTPELGTRVIVNGQARGNPIAGVEFFNAVLRIWLGDKPADADLKKGLLGG